jgi:putative tricarboxylic transport membrane protein
MIRTADLITASVLMLLGAIVVFDSLRLGIGWGTDGPKSGFFPFWLGVILLATCLVIVVQAIRRAEHKPFVTRERLGPVLKVLWPATALVVLMQFVGLYVASALYIGFYMRWIGRHSWLACVALAVGIPVATFLVFERWFLVPMPKGPLEAWLGF